MKNVKLLARQKNGKSGYINSDTKEFVIPPKYYLALNFRNGLASVQLDFNGKWGVIDESDNLIIPFKYDKISFYSEELIACNYKEKWGFIDRNDKLIIPFKYEYASWFSGGISPVKLKGRYGYINKSNEVVIDFDFDWAAPFEDDIAEVEQYGERFFINPWGQRLHSMW